MPTDDDDDDDHNTLQEIDTNRDNDSSGDASDVHSDPGPSSPVGTSRNAAVSDTPSDPLPTPITINSTNSNNFVSLMPCLLSPILRCPFCNLPFHSPTTLHCGHTICSSHFTDKCPIPSCNPLNSSAEPIIPPSSTVTFFPAESPDPPLPPTSTSRVDVTISKIISLVSRVDAELDNDDNHNDDDDDDDDDDTPLPRPSSSRVRPRRNSSASPPRIRKRRRYSPPPDDEDDLLSHLRKQSAVQRSTPRDEPLLPTHPSSTRTDILSRFEKDLLIELNCDICCTLFHQPVTTPCQHTFCSKCLHRALDHSPSCPICRQNLPGFSYFQDHPENKVLLALILKAFPTVYQERGEAIEAEEREARLDTPIFVCQLSFPGMPTLLHFFEPRYRLMLRRCLESPNPCFGMVMAPRPGIPSPHEYGTMLEIRRVQMLPDGRSVVETWGTFRFRLLESGMMDGYMVGRIERIDDYPEDMLETVEDGEEQEPPSVSVPEVASTSSAASSSTASLPPTNSSTSPPTRLSDPTQPSPPRQPTNTELMDQCRTFLDRLQRGTAPWVVQRLRVAYGTIPTDPSSFSFWVAFVIPIEEQEKAKLLPIRSPRLRLLLVTHWIEQLDNNWWFSAGCTIL